MNSSTNGIKQLMKAEEEAQVIISNARKDKSALLKRARIDAENEAKEYEAIKQREFNEYSRKHLGSHDLFAQGLAKKNKSRH
eukprot:TRINITY_DN96182_c0_g4_i1.p1 TRINITY_DN96182_c0_g4~~TRINITY_DN96182_c0_g4_i1.p1  ORF type:complete len:82 (+),score=18.92 TRINITY_DN96182_c0_g4_i1:61-306(+)